MYVTLPQIRTRYGQQTLHVWCSRRGQPLHWKASGIGTLVGAHVTVLSWSERQIGARQVVQVVLLDHELRLKAEADHSVVTARGQPKNQKNMPLQKKVVPLPPKTSIIYSLKIENYARNFE